MHIPQKGSIRDHAAKAALVSIRSSANSGTISYCALNERWFIGPRQVPKIVKRVAERVRIPPERDAARAEAYVGHDGTQKGISLAPVQKNLGDERLGTPAISLNLTDMHTVGSMNALSLESTRNPGLNLFAGICKNPQFDAAAEAARRGLGGTKVYGPKQKAYV